MVHTLATGPAPNYAVFTPDDKRLYVTNTGNGTVSEIDAISWKVIRTLDAGPSPEHLVLAPDGKTLTLELTGSDAVGGYLVKWTFRSNGKSTRTLESGC